MSDTAANGPVTILQGPDKALSPRQTRAILDNVRRNAGAPADLVLFDPATIEDAATFDNPEQPARGISKVLVAGEIAWDQGAAAGDRRGSFMTH